MSEFSFNEALIKMLEEKRINLEKEIEHLTDIYKELDSQLARNKDYQWQLVSTTLMDRAQTDVAKMELIKSIFAHGNLQLSYTDCVAKTNEKVKHLNDIVYQLRLLSEQQVLVNRDAPPDDLSWQFDSRSFHAGVVEHGRDLFVKNTPFHAVSEVAKFYIKQVAVKSQLNMDGYPLVDKAFHPEKGILKINNGVTKTEKNEQAGVHDLACGVVNAFRNILQHEPESEFPINHIECLEYLGIFSYLFKKLDLSYSIEVKDNIPKSNTKADK